MRQHRKTGSMATTARNIARGAGRTPPYQPDYSDEVTKEQLDAIRKLVDPDGNRASGRKLLYSPAW